MVFLFFVLYIAGTSISLASNTTPKIGVQTANPIVAIMTPPPYSGPEPIPQSSAGAKSKASKAKSEFEGRDIKNKDSARQPSEW